MSFARGTLPLLVITLGLAPFDGHAAAERRTLSLELPHSLSRADARQRVDELLDYWARRFKVRCEWHGDTAFIHGRTWGVTFTGKVSVGERTVQATATDPGFLLRGLGLDYVRRKLRRYLHPTYER